MATTVIFKESVQDPITQHISTKDIIVYDRGEGLMLTEPVKRGIEIKYDAAGQPNVQGTVDLGVQYDHRVTWLRFNLDDLVWHLNKQKGYTDKTKYNYYIFKMLFTNLTTKETKVWEFNGRDFEIPREVTKDTATYSVILAIEEYQGDEVKGNIKDEEVSRLERFVAAPFKGKVAKSFYSPELDITATIEESDQKDNLVKPAILGTLTDMGALSVETTEIGQQFDNFIRYVKFNPRNITAHLNDFFVFAIFNKGDKFHYSLFEQTVADDPFDDYSESHPIIAWIPSGVYQEAGTWKMAIIAFAGNLNDINSGKNDADGDYYFFVSNEAKVKVAKNELTLEDISKEPVNVINSNMLTVNNEVIIDSENQVFQAEG